MLPGPVHAAAALAAALALDLALGEYPARLHPVVWMGRAISALERRAPRTGRAQPFLYGLAMALVVPLLGYEVFEATERRLRRREGVGQY